jgi:hemerythrin-like domain-containing protein
LIEPAARARRIAAELLEFFRDAVYEHHAEEERELFPAVLASATEGAERDKVQSLVNTLSAEHRRVEAAWHRLEPRLKAVAKGRDAQIDGAEVNALINAYLAHARLEEEVFLPLSQNILGRNSNHLAALGLSLHMRHAVPRLMQRFASRI